MCDTVSAVVKFVRSIIPTASTAPSRRARARSGSASAPTDDDGHDAHGQHLHRATEVRIGGLPGTKLELLSPTQLRVTPPAGAAGLRDVTVTTPGGSATLPQALLYRAPPAITRVHPEAGKALGGDWVTLQGSDFDDASAVLFGDQPGTELIRVSG